MFIVDSLMRLGVGNDDYRQRCKAGKRVISILAGFEIEELLIAQGYLEAWDTGNPKAVSRALQRLIDVVAHVR